MTVCASIKALLFSHLIPLKMIWCQAKKPVYLKTAHLQEGTFILEAQYEWVVLYLGPVGGAVSW